MTPDEIPELLAKISLADPRVRRDDKLERRAQFDMWAGILTDVPADFALRAAHEHYRTSQWPILPADIATRWAATAADRLVRHTDPIPAVDPDRVTEWCEELGATRRAVAVGMAEPTSYAIAEGEPVGVEQLVAGIGVVPPQRSQGASYMSAEAQEALAPYRRPRRPEWSVPCPITGCRALPGEPCTGTGSRRRTKQDSHPSRLDAWLVQQQQAATLQES